MTKGTSAAEVATWFREARSVVVLTGAGMSAESGIATFRDARDGLWSQFDAQALATPSAYRADKALVWGWYVWRMAKVRAAQPNAGHLALVRLAALKSGGVVVVTQNVDDLHERAGSVGVIHLHGDLFASRCFACARSFDGFQPPADAADHPVLRLSPPRCAHCGGYVRPGVVWFGEMLPQKPWAQAQDVVRRCDLMLLVGTSGVVHPAAALPGAARARGARVVEINPVVTELSEHVDHVWRATAGESLPLLHGLLGEG
ncbi:NAD-dependent deacylase [Rhodanobacter sp. FDAARGOS 1247]|nr:NAD-dependent deacylase [Rhodanobacter sp. FDAARGOS 1247]